MPPATADKSTNIEKIRESNDDSENNSMTDIATQQDDAATAVTHDESDEADDNDVMRDLDGSQLREYNELLIQLGAFPVSLFSKRMKNDVTFQYNVLAPLSLTSTYTTYHKLSLYIKGQNFNKHFNNDCRRLLHIIPPVL